MNVKSTAIRAVGNALLVVVPAVGITASPARADPTVPFQSVAGGTYW